MSTDATPAVTTETPKEITFSIVTKDKSYTAKAQSIAWTENGLFILLMNGDVTKHIIVSANVIAVTQEA